MSRILLAVSGGMDSMYMLARSSELFPGSEVAVAHCNFGLRGAESDGDEEFVRGWCSSRGIRCFVKRFPTAEYASEKHISIEMAARDLRYAWFTELLSGVSEDAAGASGAARVGFDAVAVAHNADDNAETLLLNLLRGTGTRGLRGMGSRGLPGGGAVLRPLLGISRAEIADWMARNGVPHREDSSNAGDEYKRNKIRHSVFPVFAEINPSFLRTLAGDMRHFAQVDDIAEEWFSENAPAVAEGYKPDGGPQETCLSVPALMALKHWEYMLWRLLKPFGFDEPTLEDLKGVLLAGGTVSGKTFEAPQWKAVTGSGKIVLVKRGSGAVPGVTGGQPGMTADGLLVDGPGEYAFGDLRFSVKVFDRPAGFELQQPGGRLVFDAAALPFPLKLRHWTSGDWMQPLGLRGRKKLSDLFVDLKWSLPEKQQAAVLEHPDGAAGHIGALLCCRVDESLKVRPGTRIILEIELLDRGCR